MTWIRGHNMTMSVHGPHHWSFGKQGKPSLEMGEQGPNRVNVHNLAKAANWRSLVKTSLELQLCPLFQINRLDQNHLGLVPLVKSINLKERTQLQLQRRFYQTAPICNLRQIVHIYPNYESREQSCLFRWTGKKTFITFMNLVGNRTPYFPICSQMQPMATGPQVWSDFLCPPAAIRSTELRLLDWCILGCYYTDIKFVRSVCVDETCRVIWFSIFARTIGYMVSAGNVHDCCMFCEDCWSGKTSMKILLGYCLNDEWDKFCYKAVVRFTFSFAWFREKSRIFCSCCV
jgi:hypothetical protein